MRESARMSSHILEAKQQACKGGVGSLLMGNMFRVFGQSCLVEVKSVLFAQFWVKKEVFDHFLKKVAHVCEGSWLISSITGTNI